MSTILVQMFFATILTATAAVAQESEYTCLSGQLFILTPVLLRFVPLHRSLILTCTQQTVLSIVRQ